MANLPMDYSKMSAIEQLRTKANDDTYGLIIRAILELDFAMRDVLEGRYREALFRAGLDGSLDG